VAAAIVAGFAEHDFSVSKAAGPGVVAVVATVGALPNLYRGLCCGWRDVVREMGGGQCVHKSTNRGAPVGGSALQPGIGVCVATQLRQINLRRAHYKYASLCHYDLAVDVDMLLVGKPHKSDIACCPLLDRVAWTLVVTALIG
jgi:hypothetical protein